MKDWAEVHRLHHREGKSERAISRELKMSRNTVHRLLLLPGPPVYERSRPPSMLDPHRDAVLAMLGEDARAPATVIREHLQAEGYGGGITILKDYLQEVRPQFLLARTYQRTSYLPGETEPGGLVAAPCPRSRRSRSAAQGVRSRRHPPAFCRSRLLLHSHPDPL